MEPGTPKRMAQAKDSMGDLQLGDAPAPPAQQQQVLKFAVQIYKLRDGEYCLDFQVHPPPPPPLLQVMPKATQSMHVAPALLWNRVCDWLALPLVACDLEGSGPGRLVVPMCMLQDHEHFHESQVPCSCTFCLLDLAHRPTCSLWAWLGSIVLTLEKSAVASALTYPAGLHGEIPDNNWQSWRPNGLPHRQAFEMFVV